jgi:predicted ATPase
MQVRRPAAAQTAGPNAPPSSPAPLPAWRLRLLGAVELLDAQGLPRRLPTRAATLLLARLALTPRSQHPREELIELLWPGVAAEAGRNRLRQALSVLRSLLEAPGATSGTVLMADRRAVWLTLGALQGDVDQFLQALAGGDRATALALYQGELLPGHYDEWVLEQRRHLAARAESLAEGLALEGALGSVGPPRAPLSQAGPRDTVAELPRYLTRLFGFEAEGAVLGARIAQHRLLVLRGPGGAGKTRLAVELARAWVRRAGERWSAAGTAAPDFDQVAFVPLASCTQRHEMLDALLHTLHQDSAAHPDDASASVVTALAGRKVLLVLDNFEQLVEAGRDDLARWLSTLPLLHLLVTSRRALGLDGESEHVLAALPLPAPGSGVEQAALNASVALFVDRARAMRSDFCLSVDNHGKVGEIVRALGGLPLAIELAAARLRSLGLGEMRDMLVSATSPGSTLELLSRRGPRGAADSRHASMLQVLQWSWQQLAPADQDLLASLAAFVGGASLALLASLLQQAPLGAAVRVEELVAASVAYQRADPAGASRYEVFEPMREFVFLRAAAAGAARLRAEQARAVHDWAHAVGPAADLLAVRAEWANLLRGLASAADAQVPGASASQAIDTVLALRPALEDLPLPATALAHLRWATSQAPEHRPALIQGLLAYHSFEAGLREWAARHAQAAVDTPADPADRAEALRLAARVKLRLGDAPEQVLALADEAITLARAHGRMDVLAWALSTRSVVRLRQTRDFEANIQAHQTLLALWREHGPRTRVTSGLAGLALALGFLHRVPEQLVLLAEARMLAEQQGQTRLLAFTHSITGYALADKRRYAESARHYRECLVLAWDHASWREWFYALWNLPRTLAQLRRPEPAAQLMGFAEAFYAERFGTLGREDLPEARRTRRLVAAQLGRDAAAAHWRQGAGLAMPQAMHLAMAETAPAAPG